MKASEVPSEIVSFGHFLTRTQVARAMHLPATAVAAMRGLLRLGGRFAIQESYPAFMFEDPERLDVYRDIVQRLDAIDPWLVIGWLNQTRPELGGRTPALWIAEGLDPSRVTRLAEQAAG